MLLMAGTAYTMFMHSNTKATRLFGWCNILAAVMLVYAMSIHKSVIFPSALGWPFTYVCTGAYLVLSAGMQGEDHKSGKAHSAKSEASTSHHHKHHPFLYWFFSLSIVVQTFFSYFFSELSVSLMFKGEHKFNATDDYLVKCWCATCILFVGTLMATYMHASPKATRIFGYFHLAYSASMVHTIYLHMNVLATYMVVVPLVYTVVAAYLIYTTFDRSHAKTK